jgi:multimeric flavodoxin WrbA
MDDRNERRRPHVEAVLGSYDRGGLLDTTITEILKGAREHGAEVEKIDLVDRRVDYCDACRQCSRQPGPHRGECPKDDDVPAILDAIDSADAVVFGAPVNFGDVNAITRTLLERMLGFAYWPEGQREPELRSTRYTKRAVLVTSSSAPGMVARFLARPFPTLRRMAQLAGARVVGTLVVGVTDQEDGPGQRKLAAARELGARLARPAIRPRGARRTSAPSGGSAAASL